MYESQLVYKLFQGTPWNQTIANQMMFEQAELPFNQERNVYPVTPTGNFLLTLAYYSKTLIIQSK